MPTFDTLKSEEFVIIFVRKSVKDCSYTVIQNLAESGALKLQVAWMNFDYFFGKKMQNSINNNMLVQLSPNVHFCNFIGFQYCSD